MILKIFPKLLLKLGSKFWLPVNLLKQILLETFTYNYCFSIFLVILESRNFRILLINIHSAQVYPKMVMIFSS